MEHARAALEIVAMEFKTPIQTSCYIRVKCITGSRTYSHQKINFILPWKLGVVSAITVVEETEKLEGVPRILRENGKWGGFSVRYWQ